MMFRYTVTCEFISPKEGLVNQWLAWLAPGHIDEVVEAGALSAEVVKIDAENPKFEIRYSFASGEAFEIYERDHAPRLRADGRERFPHSEGLNYTRTVGEVVATTE